MQDEQHLCTNLKLSPTYIWTVKYKSDLFGLPPCDCGFHLVQQHCRWKRYIILIMQNFYYYGSHVEELFSIKKLRGSNAKFFLLNLDKLLAAKIVCIHANSPRINAQHTSLLWFIFTVCTTYIDFLLHVTVKKYWIIWNANSLLGQLLLTWTRMPIQSSPMSALNCPMWLIPVVALRDCKYPLLPIPYNGPIFPHVCVIFSRRRQSSHCIVESRMLQKWLCVQISCTKSK